MVDGTGGITEFGEVVHVCRPTGSARILVLCEHASNRVPEALGGLGLDAGALQSHVAWDPGALPVAQAIADRMGAGLVHGGVSRLVYDCNRPPEAPSAMPERSEIYDIPGNQGLDEAARAARVAGVYVPFKAAVMGEIDHHADSLDTLVTIHSFCPVYHGKPRAVELGILHGRDDRLARAMMARNPGGFDTRLNEPYSAADGVAHSLDLYGDANGLQNVMIEIRNDLIATPEQQEKMAEFFVPWIAAARTDVLAGPVA